MTATKNFSCIYLIVLHRILTVLQPTCFEIYWRICHPHQGYRLNFIVIKLMLKTTVWKWVDVIKIIKSASVAPINPEIKSRNKWTSNQNEEVYLAVEICENFLYVFVLAENSNLLFILGSFVEVRKWRHALRPAPPRAPSWF